MLKRSASTALRHMAFAESMQTREMFVSDRSACSRQRERSGDVGTIDVRVGDAIHHKFASASE